MSKNSEIINFINDYINYLEIEKGRSPKTQQNYLRYLKEFINFSKINLASEITEQKIRSFRLYLAQKNIKKITQSYYLIALRNFLKYLIRQNIKTLSPEKIELPKISRKQIEILEYNELEKLLNAPKENDLRTLRDKAILETLFSTGLRVSELCNLNRYINLERGEITVRGKGDKLRVVFLSERAKKAIKNYLEKRVDTEEALFISLSHSKNPKVLGRITPRTIERLIDYWSRRAGISQKVWPHMIRHSYATDLLINGADLRAVQELLGHQNISTTQVYTHLTNKELREIHRAFHAKRRK
ncbi:MAG: tyrosine-type recombinase/integrase [Patescibacteria group bacterium]|nr:tyrosine-type recombinase/integrase [Patescibacteria group bacterium]MDW8279636.1 tyrosine-type recombinase/integrase [bacterium]